MRHLEDPSVLRVALAYEPATGVFTWRVPSASRLKVGDVAGCRMNGYLRIKHLGTRYLAHRLAWVYMTGELPRGVIDHRNGNPFDNSFANLRDVTPSENRQNQRKARSDSSTGLQGVVRRGERFAAVVRIDGKRKRFGAFGTPQEAHAAYVTAKRAAHPAFN